MRRFLSFLAVLGLIAASTGRVEAGATFLSPSGQTNSTNGHPFSASAVFSVSGNTLTIVVTNTNKLAISPQYVSSDAMSSIFFDVAGSPTLVYASAIASTTRNGSTVTPNANITSEWFYAHSSSALGGDVTPLVTQHYGLGTAGLGIFNTGGGQQFPYGIMDNGFTGSNGNNPVNGATFAQNSITFSLTFTGTLSEDDISDVRFQWGTRLDEGNLNGIKQGPPVIPEPSSLVLLGAAGAAGLGLGAARRNRRRSQG